LQTHKRRGWKTAILWIGVAASLVIAALVALVGGAFYFKGNQPLDWCTRNLPTSLPVPGTQVETERKLWPPGVDCVYRDGRGNVVARQPVRSD
jgi:hypothetical protein